MNLESFKQSLSADQPPSGLSVLLESLWWDAKGRWDKAHTMAQDVPGADGCWVHAYLHRKEGDHGNAGYWYVRAGRPRCAATLAQEWDEIAAALLSRTA